MAEKKQAPTVKVVVEKDTPTSNLANEILDRLTALEKQQSVIAEAFQWAANEVKDTYGLGFIGKVFQAIADRLDK